MESGTACFVSVGPAESEGKQAKEASQGAETRSADGQEEQEVDLLPVQAATLVAAADMYAMEPKPASVAGGLLTVLAVLAAVAYTVYQVRAVAESCIPCCCTAADVTDDTFVLLLLLALNKTNLHSVALLHGLMPLPGLLR
jgi:hypothetical protein